MVYEVRSMIGLGEDNIKLVTKFGASKVSDLKEVPDFYTFSNGL